MGGLQISLFGGLHLERGDRVLQQIPSRAARSLFAFLVLNRGQELTRDLLAGTLWPDMDDAQSRKRLSQALWQIQNVLADADPDAALITADVSSVRFERSAAYWLDVEQFEAAITVTTEEPSSVSSERLAVLAEGVALYRGDLLAGFYDEWVMPEQHRLREMYFGALAYLATLHKSRGEFEQALTYARRLALHDPLREEAHREVMRLSYLAGRINEALKQYEICRTTLQDELGSEPAPETHRLYESIRSHRRDDRRTFVPVPEVPPMEVSGPLPLVGRQEPRARVATLTEAALAGRGGVVLVEGEPGVGKTRLLQAVADDAAWRGLNVLWGDARESGVPRSYAALADAFTSGMSQLRAEQLAAHVDGVWLREVARLVPDLDQWLPDLGDTTPLKSEDEPGRMREAIATTIRGLGRVTPVVVVLDDFQWADDDSVTAVAYLARSLADSNVVLCLSYRDQAARRRELVWSALRSLDAAVGAERIVLGPLSPAESGELIRRGTATDIDFDLVERLHLETGGNPLFLLETVQAIVEASSIPGGDDSPALGGDVPLPSTVHEVISSRLGNLSPRQRDVVNVHSLLGMDADVETALAAIQCTRPEFFEAVDGLIRRGILVEHSGRYRFRHEQVQRVAYLEIGDSERRRVHRAVAEALQVHQPERDEAIAHHFFGCGRWAEAADHAERAAAEAVRVRAYSTAAIHYRMAIDAATAGKASAASILPAVSGLERVLDVLGRREEQAEALAHMAALGKALGEHQGAIARRRAWYLAHTDRFGEAEAVATEAQAAEAEDGSADGVAESLVTLGTISLWSGDATAAVRYLSDAVAAAPGPARQVQARHTLGSALCRLQQYDRAAGEAEAALALFRAEDDRVGEADALGLLGIISMERGHIDEAVSHYRSAIGLCRDLGYRHGEAVNSVNLGNALAFDGKIAAALATFTDAIDLFRVIGNRRGQAMVQANAASIHHGILGDDATASDYCRSSLDYFQETDNLAGQALVFCNLADIARRRGDLSDAEDYISAGIEAAAKAKDQFSEVQLQQSQALLELELGRPQDAADTAEEALRRCRELGLADFEAGLGSIKGIALMEQGRPAVAVDAAAEAVKHLSSGSDRAYLVHFRHALALEAAGRPDEALRPLQDAYDLMTQLLVGLTDEQTSAALAVPEHQEILVAYRKVAPVMVTAKLAAADAPIGRPLEPGEVVEVTWTVSIPEDLSIDDSREARHHRIRRLLEEATAQGAVPTVEDLASALDVSVTTVRRDLRVLRETGSPLPTRGRRLA